MYKITGGTHKRYGVDTDVSKRTQNFGVDRKFREDTKLLREHTALEWTKSSAVDKVSRWLQSFGVDTQLRQQCILRKI